MNLDEFEEELKHFLEYENHPYRAKEPFDIDVDYVIGLLNFISTVHFNNCYEFDHDGKALMVFLDCYECGKHDCAKDRLDFLLREFKQMYRRGIK